MPNSKTGAFNVHRARTSGGRSGGTPAFGRFVHRPARLKPGAALVVTLHGCTQTAETYARGAGWVELADQEGFVVLAPEQTRSGNANLCFNWFLAEQAGPDGAEVQAILSMIDEIVLQEDLDPARVFVTGLSAGGAMAFALLMSHPSRFAGGGVIAGLPFAMAEGIPEALALMRTALPGRPQSEQRFPIANTRPPKLSIWQGQDDRTVTPGNADLVARQWRDIAGLPSLPDATENVGTRQSQVWTDATGNPVLEIHRLSGLGHATPIAARAPDRIGKPSAHVVDCGHSSTHIMARMWGLTERGQSQPQTTANTAREPMDAPNDPVLPFTAGARAKTTGSPPGLRENIVAGLPSGVPHNVRDLIDRSLRDAGL
ncbi:extracellular catalytic domain type 1 short-chain-length polyhydroxyalkanoate depolymerase [Brevundimonas sp.]